MAFVRREASAGPLSRAILVAGQGMDEAESATSRRDVTAASRALQNRVPGNLEIHALLLVTPTSRMTVFLALLPKATASIWSCS